MKESKCHKKLTWNSNKRSSGRGKLYTEVFLPYVYYFSNNHRVNWVIWTYSLNELKALDISFGLEGTVKKIIEVLIVCELRKFGNLVLPSFLKQSLTMKFWLTSSSGFCLHLPSPCFLLIAPKYFKLCIIEFFRYKQVI